MNLSSTLAALTDAAEGAWPTFRIERAAFRQRLLSGLDEHAADAAEAVARIHAVDLYLACGCAQGLSPALHAFASRYLSRVELYLKRFVNSSIHTEDVRRELEDTLLFGRKNSPPGIGKYTGRGPLERFVATAARNTLLTLLRAQRHGVADDVDALASQLAAPLEGPEGIVAARYEEVVREALRVALVALGRRQRIILRLHLVQGVTFTRIARMLRVHQSTVSRSFDAAIRALHGEIRQLRESLGMSESEMQSIARDLRHRIDLSLSRTLRDTRGGA
jgi:RNA polymerase sigma-70 factor (ECF subfamily)